MAAPIYYEIRVVGYLGDRWSGWFDGLAVSLEPQGETLLSGSLPDQAALYGVLEKIRNLNLELILVRKIDPLESASR